VNAVGSVGARVSTRSPPIPDGIHAATGARNTDDWEEAMIEPGTIGDWTLLIGAMASISALAVGMHRWVLPTEVALEEMPATLEFPQADERAELEEREGAA
jgi:hypothetical protein